MTHFDKKNFSSKDVTEGNSKFFVSGKQKDLFHEKRSQMIIRCARKDKKERKPPSKYSQYSKK